MSRYATPTITPLGSQCYTVVDSSHAVCTVDLRAFARNGGCTCDTFTRCCRFLLARTDKPWRCEHIMACRDYAFETEYWALVDHMEKVIELTPDELAAVAVDPAGR